MMAAVCPSAFLSRYPPVEDFHGPSPLLLLLESAVLVCWSPSRCLVAVPLGSGAFWPLCLALALPRLRAQGFL